VKKRKKVAQLSFFFSPVSFSDLCIAIQSQRGEEIPNSMVGDCGVVWLIDTLE
jgi:hypothetical protein